jgi:hypothetical protein
MNPLDMFNVVISLTGCWHLAEALGLFPSDASAPSHTTLTACALATLTLSPPRAHTSQRPLADPHTTSSLASHTAAAALPCIPWTLQVLDGCLEACGDGDVGAALAAYQARRLPDAAALTRLMVLGFPWQYRQAPLREKLWAVNLVLRAALAKRLPALFDKQVRMQRASGCAGCDVLPVTACETKCRDGCWSCGRSVSEWCAAARVLLRRRLCQSGAARGARQSHRLRSLKSRYRGVVCRRSIVLHWRLCARGDACEQNAVVVGVRWLCALGSLCGARQFMRRPERPRSHGLHPLTPHTQLARTHTHTATGARARAAAAATSGGVSRRRRPELQRGAAPRQPHHAQHRRRRGGAGSVCVGDRARRRPCAVIAQLLRNGSHSHTGSSDTSTVAAVRRAGSVSPCGEILRASGVIAAAAVAAVLAAPPPLALIHTCLFGDSSS